jgi:hypothetical protein
VETGDVSPARMAPLRADRFADDRSADPRVADPVTLAQLQSRAMPLRSRRVRIAAVQPIDETAEAAV